jgi:WhiB family redox-sensing transcriptional regulator
MRKLGTSWMEAAACAGVDQDGIFGDERTQKKFALDVCKTCPAIEPCAEYAWLNRFDYGVFGGMTEEERRRALGKTRRRIA